MKSAEDRIKKALEIASNYGQADGEHHKMYCINQVNDRAEDSMVRALTGCPVVKHEGIGYSGPYNYETQGESREYKEWVRKAREGCDGPNAYEWDRGIAP